MSTDHDFPTDVGFDDAMVTEASKKSTLSLGWFRWIIINSEKTISARKPKPKNPTEMSGGNLMIVWHLRPLKNPADATSAFFMGTQNRSVLPLKCATNKNKAPKTVFFCQEFFRAALGSDIIPNYPKFDYETGRWYFKKEVIDGKDEVAKREEVNRQIMQLSKDIWLDNAKREEFHGCAFYAELYQNGDWRNIRGINEELPDGAALVPEDDFLE